ncbi:MAG: GGDEF domain-containing protein [Thermovirgaceae bacterium]
MKEDGKHQFLPKALEGFLQTESQLVVATIDEEGNILQTNGGLRRLFRAAGRRLPGNLHGFLDERGSSVLKGILGSIPDQKDKTEPQFYKCTLHFRTGGLAVHTLWCSICKSGEKIAFFAERRHMTDSDIIEKMSYMNNELANLSRELSRKNMELERANETITRLMHTDILTGLASRRYVMDQLKDMVGDAESKGTPLSVFMADLDHFKDINDTWGHAAGDRILEAVGRLFSENLRNEDLPARIGGEEFLVLLPGLGEDEAYRCAERIRKMVEALKLEYPPKPVTCSFGVSTLKGGETSDDMLRRSDEALYRAKEAGRNRVERAP